jgi:hypothetical protein
MPIEAFVAFFVVVTPALLLVKRLFSHKAKPRQVKISTRAGAATINPGDDVNLGFYKDDAGKDVVWKGKAINGNGTGPNGNYEVEAEVPTKTPEEVKTETHILVASGVTSGIVLLYFVVVSLGMVGNKAVSHASRDTMFLLRDLQLRIDRIQHLLRQRDLVTVGLTALSVGKDAKAIASQQAALEAIQTELDSLVKEYKERRAKLLKVLEQVYEDNKGPDERVYKEVINMYSQDESTPQKDESLKSESSILKSAAVPVPVPVAPEKK